VFLQGVWTPELQGTNTSQIGKILPMFRSPHSLGSLLPCLPYSVEDLLAEKLWNSEEGLWSLVSINLEPNTKWGRGKNLSRKKIEIVHLCGLSHDISNLCSWCFGKGKMKTWRGNGESCVIICDLCDILCAICVHYEYEQRNRNVLCQSLFRINVLDKTIYLTKKWRKV